MNESNEKNLETPEEEEEIDEEVQCGIWCFHGPNCQKLASKKTTFLVFSIVAMFCGASYAYNTGIITTMEKQFKFSNKKIGVIIGFSEITSIIGSFLVPYYASAQGNFPVWISIGVILYAISFLLNGLPFFIYGSGKDALVNTLEYGATFTTNYTSVDKFKNMCLANKTINENCDSNFDEYAGVSVILAISSMITGLAEAFIIPLAVSYLDNNVKKSKMPMMLTATSFIRMLAPLVGFSLASFCLKIYVNPTLHPNITNSDPRWIGAWWMGWFILAAVLFLASPTIASFPKTLPRQAMRNKEKLLKAKKNGGLSDEPETKISSLKDLVLTFKRLLTNKVLVCNNLAAVFYVFGYIPYFRYQAKYIEVQYLFSSSMASMITGVASLIFTALGFLIGGIVITKYKPRARYLAGWNVIASIVSIFGIIGYAMFGCPANNNMETLQLSKTQMDCNLNCGCDYVKYVPVCGSNNVTYISPCHAGCMDKVTFANESFIYSNCDCVSDKNVLLENIGQMDFTTTISTGPEKIAHNGPCKVDCMRPFFIFLSILCFTKLIKGSEGMANFLLGIRCVDPKDKAVSLGLSSAMISLFAFLPSPIFFGYIIDKTCILWGKTCGQEGNCWLYDTNSMRIYMNLVACAFIFIGTLFDLGTFYYSKTVKIFDEDEDKEKEEEEGELELFNKGF